MSRRESAVFFYISGHGFGHAIRQIEVLDAVGERFPELRLVIRTSAPRWLFENTARARFTLVEGQVDTGAVQRDSLSLDEAETVRLAAAFHNDLDRHARTEAELLRREGAALVISDAPPLACAAAADAGIPAVVLSNFTWDWIYAGYSERLADAPGLLPAIRGAYALARAGWRLPMHGGFESVPGIVDLPFVARRSRADRSKEELRALLGLPVSRRLALASFGGYGVEGLTLKRLDCTEDWDVIVTSAAARPGGPVRSGAPSRVLTLHESSIYGAGLRYHDLVKAVDVVVTKPGYGIISDCIANGTSLLYTDRGRFAEYDILVSEMPRYLRCAFISGDDLREGRWRAALETVAAAPPPPETPRLDGAAVAAEMIGGYATSHSSRATRSSAR